MVDYRIQTSNVIKSDVGICIFEDGCNNNGIYSIVIVNHIERSSDRISNNRHDCRLNGLKFRDTLRISLMNYDMHRPRKEEW